VDFEGEFRQVRDENYHLYQGNASENVASPMIEQPQSRLVLTIDLYLTYWQNNRRCI